MAQAGYTPISLYFSTTAAAVPVNTNLASGELAINITDGKLYYKDNGGTVRLLASNATSAPVLSFQTSLGGLTPSTATTGVVTLAGTLNTTSGGTGLTSYTAGDLSYYASGTALTKLAIGTAGQFLTSTGTAPQWSTLSGVAVTTFSAGTTGFTPSSATAGAVTLAGTLATTNGGTNLTSFTSGGVVYASSSSALATGSALTFNGTNQFTVLAATGTTYNRTESTQYSTFAQHFATNGGTGVEYKTLYRFVDTDVGELMRLTSTGLGIGTSSPNAKLTVGTPTGAVLGIPTTATFYGTSSISSSIGTVGLFSTETAGADVGPILTFGGKSGNTYSPYPFAYIQGAKASATAGDYSGYLRFITTPSNGGSPVERMRIDSSGNLGLGVTPSAWGGLKGFQINTGLSFGGSAVNGSISSNSYYDGTNWRYNTTTFATRYDANFGNSGAHAWLVGPYGAAGDTISFTQAMTLDASGNLGVGTTSPTQRIHISNASGGSSLLVANGTNSASNIYVGTDGFAATVGSIYTNGSAPLAFGTNSTERARIDSSGNLLVGPQSFNYAANGVGLRSNAFSYFTATSTYPVLVNLKGTAGTLISLNYEDSGVGSISTTGSVTLYNTTSDQRLKENILDANSASSLIDSLQVRQFDWKKDQTHQRYGFVAQELVTVYPEAVHQPADTDEMMAVDYSKLVPMLVKEIQSLRQRLSAANL